MNKTFATRSIRKHRFNHSLRETTKVAHSRVRVVISKRAIDCLDFIQASIPLFFDIDEIYVSSRQDAIRFSVQYLSAIATHVGINTKTLKKRYNNYFVQELVRDGRDTESLDLTPSPVYQAADPESKANLTFVTTQDDDFILLRQLYKLMGVKNNDHLVEEIIYSMAACIVAFSAGYTIKDMEACQVMTGFGKVCLSLDQEMIEAWVRPDTDGQINNVSYLDGRIEKIKS